MTTFLDLLGVAALATFGYFCWPPLVLLVVGTAALAASRMAVKGGSQ